MFGHIAGSVVILDTRDISHLYDPKLYMSVPIYLVCLITLMAVLINNGEVYSL